ncbi:MAG: benzoate-CoA ligase family protein [Geminicoccaceae bacterium]
MASSAHVDSFARDNLPDRSLWPDLVFTLPELRYPERLNCAVELLDRTVATGGGERPCLVTPTATWTYRQLLEQANRIANVLVEDLGIVPGNRILLRGFNEPMQVACWFAALKAGAVVVVTMPMLRAGELQKIVDKAEIALALCDARLGAELECCAQQAPVLSRVVYWGEASGDGLELLAARRPADFANVATAADDVALIAFTSGTTGQPKGTMHFHRDVLAICDCFPPHVLKARPDDMFTGSPPLAFTFGLGGLVLFPMRIGASTLLLEAAPPAQLAEAIARHRATVLFTAPTAYRAMLGLGAGAELGSLRKCVSAGEALPAATFEAWRERTGLTLIDGIGATEMLHIFISATEDAMRPGATGVAVPGYEARIVDAAGEPVPDGEPGRLAVRGPTGCRYLADERQRDYVQRGWNITGDTYLRDADGYFRYQARSDDMIVSAGYNIAAPEVEEALLAHDAVLECAVVGAPDDARGQIVKAFVVLRPELAATAVLATALQDFVKARIAPYKYPRAVEFVAELPKTQTGKLQRFRLRHQPGGGDA